MLPEKLLNSEKIVLSLRGEYGAFLDNLTEMLPRSLCKISSAGVRFS